MRQRVFEKQPGQIRFTEDFHEQPRGSLLPGQPIDLEFADSRIPEEPTGAAWLEACVQFDGGPVVTVPLHLRQGWRDIDPALTERGEGNLWVGTVTPPEGTKEMSIWFKKTLPSGKQYYDSRFGSNYWFRFPQVDLKLLSATVDETGFQVEIEAVPEITSTQVEYHILNAGAAPGVLSLAPAGSGVDSKRRWTGSASIDARSVVSFAIVYTAGGHTYTDDNQRRGYLAPDPEAILAAKRAELTRSKKE
jgi:hypothetical protein